MKGNITIRLVSLTFLYVILKIHHIKFSLFLTG